MPPHPRLYGHRPANPLITSSPLYGWVPSSSSTTPRPPSRSFVSTYTNGNGSDDWSTLTPSARDPRSWGGWELVAFKNAHDSDRAGKYVPVSSQVVFTDLENIEVE